MIALHIFSPAASDRRGEERSLLPLGSGFRRLSWSMDERRVGRDEPPMSRTVKLGEVGDVD